MPELAGPEPQPEPDGRRRRGQAQRRLLLEATLEIIARRGVGGVTQRAVAAQAGVSAASVFYYFDTIDHLLGEVLRMVNGRYVAGLRAARGDGLAVLADLVADSVTTSRQLAIAELELYMRAIRDPGLREELRSWWAAVDDLIRPSVADPNLRALLVAAVDGLFLRQLAADHPMDRDAVRALLAGVAGAGGGERSDAARSRN
jgi:DNA-binding transcriptional regulator YbjK